MFGFFKKRVPPEPPTAKQRRYAAILGIEVTPTMSRAELSQVIAASERRNPELAEKRKRVNAKVQERKHERRHGKEQVAEEKRWDAFSREVGYMLAIYRWRKAVVADVLQVVDVYFDDRDKLLLLVEAPKLIKETGGKDWLFWEREFELPVNSLLYHEPLRRDFDREGIRAYWKAVERGLKLTKRL
jgi:hypothetical protein